MALVTAFRIADWITPVRVNGHRSAGRFNRPGEVTQYCCLHPLGPWAEFVRREDPTEALLGQFRHRLWAVRVELRGAVHVDWDTAPSWGISPDDLVADDYRPCHELADRLRERGVRVAVVPSAALPGTRNVVVLAPQAPAPYNAEPVGPEDCPCALLAEDATVPATVLPLVRRVGEPHAELDSWRRGRAYAFLEPPIVSAPRM